MKFILNPQVLMNLQITHLEMLLQIPVKVEIWYGYRIRHAGMHADMQNISTLLNLYMVS